MKLNCIVSELELIGTTIKVLEISNNIIDIEKGGERKFGLYINEPQFQKEEGILYGQMLIDIELDIKQSDEEECKIQFSIEGAFASAENIDEDTFKRLVIVNGAAALIGVARGKIETISANVFNNGKIVIPFVNVVDYYKSLEG